MGLDQYAKVLKCNNPEHAEEFAYWRKHANLQGWMEKLWRERGCPIKTDNGIELHPEEEFNCVPLSITLEDLDRLEKDVKDQNLPETTGFFFGVSTPEKDSETLKFIKQAREYLTEGYTVFYFAWY